MLALAFVGGCALFQALGTGKREYAFSHREHVVEQELECSDCHLTADSADDPGLPGAGTCRLCHEELDAEKPPERQVASLFDGKDFRAEHHGALGAAIVFPHLRHVEAELECKACHVGIEGNEDVLELPVMRMDDCVRCHEQRGVANDCASCHPTILQDVPPSSHEGQWERIHGALARTGSSLTADRCDLCHTESSCTSCHQTQLPQSHTNQWRLFGHGVAASLDRQSCATCHRSDSCIQCHRESAPRSHVGAFGAPQNFHCISCHQPVQSEGCATCHAGTPSHALAAPKPAGHTPAMNCRQCHGVPGGQPLPHVDNGDNCNACHH